MPYIKVHGQYKHFFNNLPASAGQIVKIELVADESTQNDFDMEAIYLAETYSVVLKDDGYLPDTDKGDTDDLLLWCNVSSKYKFTDPDNRTWEAIVSYGDGLPKNITEIRAGGVEVETPETINSLIDTALTQKAVRADIEQTFTTEEKDRVKAALEIPTGGGSETATTLGALINGASAKSTPVDLDMFALMDSAASNIVKKLSWANLKSAVKSYYDSVAATLTNKTISGSNNTLSNIPQSAITNLTTDLAEKSDILGTNEIETGTSYTLNAADVGKVIVFTNNAGITLTVDSGLPEGFNCAVIQLGNGQITFVGAGGVTIVNPLSHTKSIKNGMVTIYSYDEDEFIFQGATE